MIVPAVLAFDEVTIARRVTESIELRFTNECVRTAVAESPESPSIDNVSVAESIVRVCETTVACDGMAEKVPNPKEAIAINAIRLKNVLLDITFLSRVALETFPSAADRENLSVS